MNDYIDKVYVVNMDKDVDRLEHMDKEFERIGVKYKRIPAVDASKNEYIINKYKNKNQEFRNAVGLLKSHVGIMKDALDNKYDTIAIFEDDVIFCDDFDERFDYYIKNLPKDWQVAYLGCHFHSCRLPTVSIDNKNYIYSVKKCYGTFAMVFNNQNGTFDKIIKHVDKEQMPLDNYYAHLLLGILKGYVFIPFFVKTAPFKSTISSHDGVYSVVDEHFNKRLFGL